MHSLMRRIASLALALLLALTPALADGMRFTLQATVHPDACTEDLPPLTSALALLLEAATLSGSFITDDGTFRLDAAIQLTDGAATGKADLHLFGIDSHWSIRSSLLGETELMVNCASLLPFGMKARDFLGLPLDAAALLVPYTHVDALSAAMDLLAPLFPAQDGKTSLTRAEIDAIVSGLERLCDEDPALNRYLEVTGLYRTAKYYCSCYFGLPQWIFSSLTVKRDGKDLTWSAGVVTVLKIREKDGRMTASFTLPTLASIDASLAEKNGQLTGSITADMDSIQADIDFTLPTRLTSGISDIRLTVDASSYLLPEDGFHLRVTGHTQGNDLTLHLLHPEWNATILTVTGKLIPFASDPLPPCTPEDFTGFNILSVNSDSLQHLIRDVKWPLMTGLFELVAAAPARAVQQLMDYAEAAGLIDLLTSALDGSEGY